MRRLLRIRRWIGLVLVLSLAASVFAITPRPPKPKLFATAPEDCLFYFHNFGFTDADSDSKSRTEQLFMEPSVQTFIGEVKSLIDQGVKRAIEETGERGDKTGAKVMEELFDLGKLVIDRPYTFYVGDVEISQRGPEKLDLALVLDAGDRVDEVEKRLLELQSKNILAEVVSQVTVAGVKCNRLMSPDSDGPPTDPPAVHWGKVGNYILVAVGSDAMESLMKNVKGPAPKWLKPAVKRVDVPRRWIFSYANVEKIIGYFNEIAPSAAQEVVEATGLTDVSTITAAMGLDEEGMVSRSLIATDSDQGLLQLFERNGLTAADLAEVPNDAVGCLGMRLSPEKVVDTLLDLAVEVSGEDRAEVEGEVDGLSAAIGVDIREDIIAGLGDRWLVYALPGAAGAMVPNTVIAVDIKDASGVQRGLNVLKQMLDNQGGQVSVGETTIGDHAAYYLKGVPIAPAWCLTKDRLIIGAQKSLIGKLLDSPPAPADSLAAHPRIKSLLSEYEKPMVVTYSDAKSSLSAIYQAVPMLLNMASGALEENGIDFDVTNLPPLEDIVKHLDPSVGVIHRAPDGIEFASRKTLPSAGVGAATPIAVALLLPAVQQARGAARRTQSQNNVRQILLACLNFESANRRLPAAKIGEDGKHGLSWRVAILPYIEQNELYNEFHLDEPWDSEHNKKLIAKMPEVYRSPKSKAEEGKTNYLAIRGDDSIISGEGDKGTRFRDITDGTSNTILAVEVNDANAVFWTKPDDYEWDEDNPSNGISGLQRGAFVAGFCDGSVQMIANDVDEDTLKALFTRNGGEVINRADF